MANRILEAAVRASKHEAYRRTYSNVTQKSSSDVPHAFQVPGGVDYDELREIVRGFGGEFVKHHPSEWADFMVRWFNPQEADQAEAEMKAQGFTFDVGEGG